MTSEARIAINSDRVPSIQRPPARMMVRGKMLAYPLQYMVKTLDRPKVGRDAIR